MTGVLSLKERQIDADSRKTEKEVVGRGKEEERERGKTQLQARKHHDIAHVLFFSSKISYFT